MSYLANDAKAVRDRANAKQRYDANPEESRERVRKRRAELGRGNGKLMTKRRREQAMGTATVNQRCQSCATPFTALAIDHRCPWCGAGDLVGL